MRFQRAVSVMTLLAFLPLATGCSTSKIASINAEPEAGREGEVIDAYEEPVEINAYTLVDGQRHEWRGVVQAAGLDSLEFRRRVRSASISSGEGNAPPVESPAQDNQPRYESRRLARADVASVDRRVVSGVKTTGLVVALMPVALFALLAFAYYATPPSERL